MLLETFLAWNLGISSFQCEIKEDIRIGPHVGAILIGQKDVKIDDFWGLGMSQEKPST